MPEPETRFVDLCDEKLHLVPEDTPLQGTLTSQCLRPANGTERTVLCQHFGVRSWSLAEFYR